MMPFLLPCAPTGLASIVAWCGSSTTPSGSAVVTCLNATARTRRAERAIQSDVLSVWQVLHGTPSVPRISAQRIAQFDDHCTSNLFINNKLRQRYSRYKEKPSICGVCKSTVTTWPIPTASRKSATTRPIIGSRLPCRLSARPYPKYGTMAVMRAAAARGIPLCGAQTRGAAPLPRRLETGRWRMR
jgi:hypothetical protein